MTEKELKKLSRFQLLQLLVAQTERTEELQQMVSDLEKLLNANNFEISNLGSIAEASIQVAGVLEAAQKAADIYLNAARKQAAAVVQEAHRQANEILAQAEAEARGLTAAWGEGQDPVSAGYDHTIL